ncbi:glutathionylspermidine synthase family protein [soil metagenome]
MERLRVDPRPNWRQTVESQGFHFHSIDGLTYWDESACYLFEADEIDLIEEATNQLEAMCLEAVEHVIREDLFPVFEIPNVFADLVIKSWERGDPSIYGRFDLSYNGQGPPKLLEYNADTPTALLEAAVIQWFWLQDRGEPGLDQFNSLHERLIEAWEQFRAEGDETVHFLSMSSSVEDFMTVSYLQDTAMQAGLDTRSLDIEQIGWNHRQGQFVDLDEHPMRAIFKLYPWEWMIREPFGIHLPETPMRWIEPPWKLILSNKAILVILHDLFPDSPYLLRTDFSPIGDTYVSKPILSREGANITILQNGRVLSRTEGAYEAERRVYQEYHPLPESAGKYPVIGSWIVNGVACGMGIREDTNIITKNTSRFIPHAFRL